MLPISLRTDECDPIIPVHNIGLSVVVPLYKEEENIGAFLARIIPVLSKMAVQYEIIFCLDPSPDRSEQIVEDEIKSNPNLRLIVFSRRFGQPAATMAGILSCEGKNCVVIDIDLQDAPEIIPQMYEKLKEGYEVVSARRRSRKGETVIKRFVSRIGYKVISTISDVDIPSDVGDFRIMTRKVIEELRRLQETHGFLRGLVSFVGFRQTTIDYDREARHSGHGKYNRLFGSFRIGFNGIICFSSKPLQLMSIIGIVFAGFSFLLGGWYVLQKLIGVSLTPALPTIVLVVTFFAGIQLLALGLIGEYIGRIYDEVKNRPLYIIKKTVNM